MVSAKLCSATTPKGGATSNWTVPMPCPNTELERTLVLTHYSQSVISEPDSVYPLFAGDPCDLSLATAKFFRFPAGGGGDQ